jgi:Glyoxalase-like domain
MAGVPRRGGCRGLGGAARRRDGGVPRPVDGRGGSARRGGGTGSRARWRGGADDDRRRPAHRAVDPRHVASGATARSSSPSRLGGGPGARSCRRPRACARGAARRRGAAGHGRCWLLARCSRVRRSIRRQRRRPARPRSTVWMQELDPAKPLRHAMHVDVSVAREQVEARLAAALAAGGRIVDDSSAPAAWILADRAGNRVCIAAWPDGSSGPAAVGPESSGPDEDRPT